MRFIKVFVLSLIALSSVSLSVSAWASPRHSVPVVIDGSKASLRALRYIKAPIVRLNLSAKTDSKTMSAIWPVVAGNSSIKEVWVASPSRSVRANLFLYYLSNTSSVNGNDAVAIFPMTDLAKPALSAVGVKAVVKRDKADQLLAVFKSSRVVHDLAAARMSLKGLAGLASELNTPVNELTTRVLDIQKTAYKKVHGSTQDFVVNFYVDTADRVVYRQALGAIAASHTKVSLSFSPHVANTADLVIARHLGANVMGISLPHTARKVSGLKKGARPAGMQDFSQGSSLSAGQETDGLRVFQPNSLNPIVMTNATQSKND